MHAAGWVLAVVGVIRHLAVLARLHCRLGGVGVQVDQLLACREVGTTDTRLRVSLTRSTVCIHCNQKCSTKCNKTSKLVRKYNICIM